jgi:cellulose synthase/poly-beta-1,6-N-acetylglucosamine synthase-like glycosyltransferase
MQLSVIIPAYNEEKYLPATLERIVLALSNTDGASEIIVVDNESDDKTREIAESFGAKVVSESEHNIAKVRNTGGKNAAGEVLIFVDADTLVPDGLFRKIAGALEDDSCYGGAVAVEYDQFARKWLKYYFMGWQFWENIFNTKQGATQFCRRAAFHAIGGYNEKIYMGEDVDFYWRLTKYAKQKQGSLFFIASPKVKTSARRFSQMKWWKILVITHPFFMYPAAKSKRFWKDWYEKPVR